MPASAGLVACPRHLYSAFRAGHPGWLRCSSLRYSRYPRSSRLAIRAPRSEIRCTTDTDRPLGCWRCATHVSEERDTIASMADAQLDDRGTVEACPSCGKNNRIQYERLGDPVRCGSCQQALAPPAAPIEIGTAADFDRLVSRASIPDRRRFLGALVRTLPDGRPRARQSSGSRGGTLPRRQGEHGRRARARSAVWYPLDSDHGRLRRWARGRSNHRRASRGRHRSLRRPGRWCGARPTQGLSVTPRIPRHSR